MVLGVVGTSFTQCNRFSQFSRANEATPGMVVAQVGEWSITDTDVDQTFQAAQNQDPQSSMGSSVDQLPLAVGSVRNLIQSALLLELGKKNGLQPNEEDAVKQAEATISGQLVQMKQMLIAQKQLSDKASEADFAKILKQRIGMDPDELREQKVTEIRQGFKLKNPAIVAGTLSQPLLNVYKKTVTVTDEELSHQNDSFEYKVITLKKGDVAATAKKVVAELKAGASFESLIDKYSDDAPEPKKKLSESLHPLGRTMAGSFELYKPLLKLKVGEVSDPFTFGPSQVIYKMISIKSQPKAEFEKQKATIRESALTSKASEKMLADLKDSEKKADIVWKSEGYRVVYEFGRIDEDTQLSKQEKSKQMLKIVDDAVKAEADTASPFTARWASVVAFVGFNKVYVDATPAEKTALDAKKIDVFKAYLNTTEDASLRIELVKAYMDKKDGAGVTEQLISAANANVAHPDSAGQSIFNEINKYQKQAQDAGYLKPDQLKQIEDLQRQWVQAKKDKDQYDAENKKAQEEQAKRQAEYDKQAAKDKAAADTAAKAAQDAANKDKPKGDEKKPADGSGGILAPGKGK